MGIIRISLICQRLFVNQTVFKSNFESMSSLFCCEVCGHSATPAKTQLQNDSQCKICAMLGKKECDYGVRTPRNVQLIRKGALSSAKMSTAEALLREKSTSTPVKRTSSTAKHIVYVPVMQSILFYTKEKQIHIQTY